MSGKRKVKMVKVSVTLPAAAVKALKAVARRNGASLSDYIRYAVYRTFFRSDPFA